MPSSRDINPRTKLYEWCGPLGAAIIVASLQLVVIAVIVLCGEYTCDISDVSFLFILIRKEMVRVLPMLPLTIGLELAWLGLTALMYLAPLGTVFRGLPLRNNKTLDYNINSIYAFVLCHGVVGLLHITGIFRLRFIVENILALALASIIISIVMSIALYFFSFRPDALLALGGNTGNHIYDFWVGRELNPRIGDLDLKFICVLRPGLIGWSIINWAYVAEAHRNGTAGASIYLIALLESFYVIDALVMEASNLTMMNVVTDGFGFMLCFGSLTWVPFTYSLKTRFLYYYPQFFTNIYTGFCIAVFINGYILFRGANSEKNRFRKNLKDIRVAHLKALKTTTGKSLIVSGYWGICRHPNYVGDWMMTLSVCLLTGTSFMLPYFHSIFLAIFLIHRQFRDEDQMLIKYGEDDWNKYCSCIPYRLIPYIY